MESTIDLSSCPKSVEDITNSSSKGSKPGLSRASPKRCQEGHLAFMLMPCLLSVIHVRTSI